MKCYACKFDDIRDNEGKTKKDKRYFVVLGGSFMGARIYHEKNSPTDMIPSNYVGKIKETDKAWENFDLFICPVCKTARAEKSL